MKIGNKQLSHDLGLNKTKSKGAEELLGDLGKTSKNAKKPGASDSARVDVSSRAQAMAKAKAIASHQDVDEAKVARLQKMIDAGEYKVDSTSIADRMVDEHLKTLG